MKRGCQCLFWGAAREEGFLILGDKVLWGKIDGLKARFETVGLLLQETAHHEEVVKLRKEQTELSTVASLIDELHRLENSLIECEDMEKSSDKDPELIKFIAEEKTKTVAEILNVEEVTIDMCCESKQKKFFFIPLSRSLRRRCYLKMKIVISRKLCWRCVLKCCVVWLRLKIAFFFLSFCR
jgi:hypothetical protein